MLLFTKKDSNNKKSRLNAFSKFLMVYAGILVAAILIIQVLLYGLLKDYEKSMPNHTMNEFVKEFTEDNMEQLLTQYPVKVSEFETNDTLSAYFKQKIHDNEVVYQRKSGEYTNNTPVYIVKAGNTAIAKVTLTESGKNGHNFTMWKVGEVSFSDYVDAENEITITAPSVAAVKINGVKVSDSYITQKDITFDPVKNVSAYVTAPTKVIYKVSGLLSQPEITADIGGTALDVHRDGKVCTVNYPTDAVLLDSQRGTINAINEAYGKYIINRGSLNALNSYLIGHAKTYMSDIPAVWAFLYGKTYTYEFRNQSITNMVKYSDDCFSCNSYYDLYVKWNEGEKTYNTSMVYTFVKINNSWYLADFSLN